MKSGMPVLGKEAEELDAERSDDELLNEDDDEEKSDDQQLYGVQHVVNGNLGPINVRVHRKPTKVIHVHRASGPVVVHKTIV